jgi:beta-glucanase (GH16 family)
MKKIEVILITLLLIINNVKGQPESIWQLLQDGSIIRWAYSGGDEFNGTELDLSKWNECFEWGCDYNPNSYFIKGPSHHILDNGNLKLATKYEPGYYEIWHWDSYGNFYTTQEYRPYTSGMIVAKQKYKYGLFEIRCKLPVGKGLWPAFWLFGGNPNQELDIFEYKGETPNKIQINTHCPSGCEDYDGFIFPQSFGGWVTANGNFSDGFNNIMAEWGPNACFWYLNGQEFAIWLGNFTHQQFLIANAAVANNCPSPFCPGPDGTTLLPAYFEIDYIRVWTRLDCENTITISNYNQTLTDPTVITGQNINVTNMTLASNQSLKLIATNQITIGANSPIEGDFEAKIVDCPGPQMKMANTTSSATGYSDRSLKIITDFPVDTINNETSLLKEKKSIENRLILSSKIFPNPSDGVIKIEFEGNLDYLNIKIELINSAGQIVFSRDLIAEKLLNIDISHLPKGIYFLKGTFGEKSVSDKIILE